MKAIIIFLLLIFACSTLFAQEKDLNKIADSIYNEGMRLYKSEWASWHGTDVFREKCTSLQNRSTGYLSYDNGSGLINIFFSEGTDPKVLSTISFEYDLDAKNYKLDTVSRSFNAIESNLYAIRQTALKEMAKDTFFRHYDNTNLNLIPIINNNIKKVYILTGPSVNGVVIFGNDYLINFDNDNNIINKKRLHKNLIPVYTDKDTTGTTTFHTHLAETGDFMTSTDVCTLLLYEKFTKWSQHYVGSPDYFSIWDCKKDKLVIITMEAMKRIQESQKKQPEAPKKN